MPKYSVLLNTFRIPIFNQVKVTTGEIGDYKY